MLRVVLPLWLRLKLGTQLCFRRKSLLGRDAYLQQWLAWLLASSPVSHLLLPTFHIREGRVVITPSSHRLARILDEPDPAPDEMYLVAYGTGDPGEARRIAEEQTRLQSEEARLDLEAHAAREARERVVDQREAAEAAAETAETSLARKRRWASGGTELESRVSVAVIPALLFVETLTVTGPWLDWAGIDTQRSLLQEISRAPLPVFTALVLAPVTTVVLYFLARGIIVHLRWLFGLSKGAVREDPAEARAGWTAIGAIRLLRPLLALGVMFFIAAGLAQLRSGYRDLPTSSVPPLTAVRVGTDAPGTESGNLLITCLGILLPLAAAALEQQRRDARAQMATIEQALETELISAESERRESKRLQIQEQRIDATEASVERRAQDLRGAMEGLRDRAETFDRRAREILMHQRHLRDDFVQMVTSTIALAAAAYEGGATGREDPRCASGKRS